MPRHHDRERGRVVSTADEFIDLAHARGSSDLYVGDGGKVDVS